MSNIHENSKNSGEKEIGLGTLTSSLGGFRIKTNPMKILKKIANEGKIRGKKPYSQVIEETRAHLVDSGQVVGLSERYLKTQKK